VGLSEPEPVRVYRLLSEDFLRHVESPSFQYRAKHLFVLILDRPGLIGSLAGATSPKLGLGNALAMDTQVEERKMTPRQRRGIIVVLVGLAVPIVALGFTSGPPHVPRFPPGLLDQVRGSEIVLVQGKGPRESACLFLLRDSEADKAVCLAAYDKDPRPVNSTILPYRYIFAVGVITILAGVGMILLGGTPPTRVGTK
jgi:hypothetical protein